MKRTTMPLALALALALGACSDDPLDGLVPGTGPAVSDTDLRMLVQPSTAWTYFRNVSTPIARASTSPHPEPFIRVRYNAFAATQLDASGFVKTGAVFPDSSVIVKELSDGATVSTLAVMMKLNGSRSAGFGGWIWAEYPPVATVRYSTTERGGACSSCHARGIDYTRMNDTHP